jgi:hypothetical protein
VIVRNIGEGWLKWPADDDGLQLVAPGAVFEIGEFGLLASDLQRAVLRDLVDDGVLVVLPDPPLTVH